MRAIIPPLRRVPDGASDEIRRTMYRQAMTELVRYNPFSFLPPGVKLRWWHRLMGLSEYPAALLENPTVELRLVVTEGALKKNVNPPPIGQLEER